MSAELSTEQSIAKRLKQLGCLEMLQSLGLVEHRGGVDRVTPGAGQEVGGAQEDRGAIFPVPL